MTRNTSASFEGSPNQPIFRTAAEKFAAVAGITIRHSSNKVYLRFPFDITAKDDVSSINTAASHKGSDHEPLIANVELFPAPRDGRGIGECAEVLDVLTAEEISDISHRF